MSIITVKDMPSIRQMREPFREKWDRAVKNVSERERNDESLKILLKKHEKLVKRLSEVERDISIRRGQIFFDEVRKELTKETG